MAQTVFESFAQQYSKDIRILSQQWVSRLQRYCQVHSGIVGASLTVERMGKTEAYDITSRHADTKYVDTPHSRRWIDLVDKGWSDLYDELDRAKMVASAENSYARLGVAAMNRTKDRVILAAVRGVSRTNSGSVALPTIQKIAEGGTGMTIGKLLNAKEILDSNEVQDDASLNETGQSNNMDVSRVVVLGTKQLTNLYNTTEIKSVDYNTVKALYQGNIDTFLGFKFVRSELLDKVGTTRFCLVWSRGYVGFGIGKDITTSIDVLPSKNMSTQIYIRESIGATRLEDEGVVEIGCFE